MNTKTSSNKSAESAAKAAAAGNGSAVSSEMTIDELARKTGMTVRNIRAHQSRGLLPAPNVRGRIGYYDDRHVARLDLIQQLQAGGFNLTAIQKLVERAEQTGDDIGNLRSLVLTPFAEEQSEVISLAEFKAQSGEEVDDRLLKKAIDLGFVVPLDGDRYEILSPTILRAGVTCVQLGIPIEMLLDVLKSVNNHSRAIADAFARMVDEGVIRPVEKDGLPPESFPQVLESIRTLRPLAAEVALAGFQVNMDIAAEEAFGKILKRIAREDRKRPESKPVSKGKGEAKGKTSSSKSGGKLSRPRRRS
ncbi:MAG: MerR family transcriptional regulator [Actinobacteria bacterium]|nr:MerR family transcriptional regulator [Actinomycetota bacterium]